MRCRWIEISPTPIPQPSKGKGGGPILPGEARRPMPFYALLHQLDKIGDYNAPDELNKNEERQK
jgi:hypothetical protein